MTARKLIIDADPGLGDAAAIALALCDPRLEVLGLTATGGQVSGKDAFSNLQAIVTCIDPKLWPRFGYSEADAAVVLDAQDKTGLLVHRGEGLGDCDTIEASRHQPTDSARLMIELVKAHPGEVTILTLGPLTNLQLAMQRWPDFLNQLGGLICCGGSLSGQGDASATAEFNIYADPEAARAVLTARCTKTMVPLETCQDLILTFDQYDSLPIDEYSRLGRFLSQVLPCALRETRKQIGREEIELREVVALAAIAHPNLFDRTSMCVDVELSGELTRGMTVFDMRGIERWATNIDVLTNVDTHGMSDYLIRLILASHM